MKVLLTNLKNIIFKTIEELEKKVEKILLSYTSEQIKSLVSYKYIIKVINIRELVYIRVFVIFHNTQLAYLLNFTNIPINKFLIFNWD
ncbi:hypothetical protein JCM11957_08600 [Caminibacter profundus]